jgi:hypothetical protein
MGWRSRRFVAGVAALAMMGLAAGSAAAAGAPWYLSANGGDSKLVQHPRNWNPETVPSEGHDYFFTDLVWHGWGHPTATATGKIKLCSEQITQCKNGEPQHVLLDDDHKLAAPRSERRDRRPGPVRQLLRAKDVGVRLHIEPGTPRARLPTLLVPPMRAAAKARGRAADMLGQRNGRDGLRST